MNNEELLVVAKLGKPHSLKGELKLLDLSDFPGQYKKGLKLFCEDMGELTIEHYSSEKGFVKFVGINSKEDAAKLTNRHLYLTKERTELSIEIGENDLFYHQAIGFKIVENGAVIGEVFDIRRIGNIDYLEVRSSLLGEEREYLIPYIDRFIIALHKNRHEIETRDCKELFEES